MDFGRKNSPSSSTSTFPSLTTRVFPMSWFSYLKQIGKKHECQSSKTKWKTSRRDDTKQFVDDDSYWQFSFGEASDAVDREGDAYMFTNMVSNARKMRNLERSPAQTPRRRIQKERRSPNTKQGRRTKKEEEASIGSHEKLQVVREEESKESGKQRKSVYVNREVQKRRAKQSCKVKLRSPRTPSRSEICRIRALEDMKKAKKKWEESLEEYAVVKCSFDPQKDFRDSMVEMIAERRIRQPEELENLLACYLSLNSHEHHDIIVRVFRQVWLDMNRWSSFIRVLKADHKHD